MTLREDSLSSGYLINLIFRGVVQYSQNKFLKSGNDGRQPRQPYQKMTLTIRSLINQLSDSPCLGHPTASAPRDSLDSHRILACWGSGL